MYCNAFNAKGHFSHHDLHGVETIVTKTVYYVTDLERGTTHSKGMADSINISRLVN